jgi:predicted transcriptional regulator
MNTVMIKAIELAGSQAQLAKTCKPEISQTSISAYLRGTKTPRISTAKRLQAAVGNLIKWDEFVTGIAKSEIFYSANNDERTKKADERTNPAKAETTQAQTGENHAGQVWREPIRAINKLN